MERRRVDTLLAERGLSPSRTSAAAQVRAGRVRVGRGGARATKPGQMVEADAELVVDEPPRYVSRGALKLENALAALGIDPSGRDCLDVGASTGGFTDCLLRHGAARVVALDVARGQLDWGLRNDPRVHVIERANARALDPSDLPWPPSLATIDVSFIGLRKVLPAVARCVAPDGDILALVKPQFELGRERVGKGGVVRDPADRREAVLAVARAAQELGLTVLGVASSGLPGPKGNRETFVWSRRGGEAAADLEALLAEADL
jgi:23S rRNA (cytidine1920-2'-O)/16S rRNA (cytidine1409-2'-O)-methyltransferase